MAFGMTYDEYWYDDALKARTYANADREKQERINEQAWLYGFYVFKALAATVGNFGLKKGAKPIEYPAEPIGYEKRKTEAQKKKEQEARQKAEQARLVAHLNKIAEARRKQQ